MSILQVGNRSVRDRIATPYVPASVSTNEEGSSARGDLWGAMNHQASGPVKRILATGGNRLQRTLHLCRRGVLQNGTI